MNLTERQIRRFWEKVEKVGPIPEHRSDLGPCWVWTSATKKVGYGEVGFNYKVYRAHRVAFELTIGSIPEGLELDHLCRVRSCVNPSHLEPVTHAENVRRGGSRNRLKTHCWRGHELSGDNVAVYGTHRHCLTCQRIRDAS